MSDNQPEISAEARAFAEQFRAYLEDPDDAAVEAIAADCQRAITAALAAKDARIETLLALVEIAQREQSSIQQDADVEIDRLTAATAALQEQVAAQEIRYQETIDRYSCELADLLRVVEDERSKQRFGDGWDKWNFIVQKIKVAQAALAAHARP